MTIMRRSIMDAQAEGLSQLIGAKITVNRVEIDKGFSLYGGRVAAVERRYEIAVERGEHSWRFKMGKNPNEVKRLLAILSDLIQTGFVQVEDAK